MKHESGQLFESPPPTTSSVPTPLAERMRPRSFEEFVGQQTVLGPESGDLLVLAWGGTYGACMTAVNRSIAAGLSVAHAHLRYLNPFPRNLAEILGNYRKVLIPELNLGYL